MKNQLESVVVDINDHYFQFFMGTRNNMPGTCRRACLATGTPGRPGTKRPRTGCCQTGPRVRGRPRRRALVHTAVRFRVRHAHQSLISAGVRHGPLHESLNPPPPPAPSPRTQPTRRLPGRPACTRRRLMRGRAVQTAAQGSPDEDLPAQRPRGPADPPSTLFL
jgi:hypothetical protein